MSNTRPDHRARLVGLLLAVLLGACDSPTGEDSPKVVSPEEPATVTLVNLDAAGNRLVRFDVDGDPIDAHGGEIRYFEGTYYLYGETYGCGFEWHKLSPSPFCGYRVYSSPNLVDWTDHGPLFDVSGWVPWQGRCHGWSNGCFRPHVVYNAKTRKYVLWVNVYDHPVSYYVLESDSPTGPFVERGVPRLAFNMDAPQGRINNGDHNLFVDDDGTGYMIYTEWHQGNGDMVIEQLTPDYLSGTGRHVRLGVRRTEAPSMFKRDGRYYVTLGDPNCAYCETGTYYFTAPSPLGPWSKGKRISANSCGGQPGHVSELPAPSGGKWYLYQSDLWLNSDGVLGGDLNQAPAPQFWAPLLFDRSGEIQPVTCAPSYGVPALITRSPSPEPEYHRLQCDIGVPTQSGRLYRELRFTPRDGGRLRSVTVNTYQRGEPDAPLVVDVRSVGPDTGTVLHREAVEPRGASWEAPPGIWWTARKLTVPVDVPVVSGTQYALRLHATPGRGCYGFAFRDDLSRRSAEAYVSDDAGKTWTAEPERSIRFELSIDR